MKVCRFLCVLVSLSWSVASFAATVEDDRDLVTLSLTEVAIGEAMAMIAKQKRLNILLSDEVEGILSLNLYDVPIEKALRAIANAAGYAVERRDNTYFIVEPEKVGLYNTSDLTEVRSFNIHYADVELLEEMLEPYLSRFGKIKSIPERNLILVSDKTEFLDRLALLVRHSDKKPRQVVIEASILEVSLSNEDSFGIDWTKLFDSQDGSGTFGNRGFAVAGNSGNSGFFFDFVNPNIDVLLTALQQDGRVKTLSTPKLVALDNVEAEVIIGDRRGYTVTTTINQVTSETIEFLESGVILRVTPHIDNQGRILLDIHPEVSTGTVDAAGIPSQTTTEVTTSLLVPNGETVFIGGLIKHSASQNYQRLPVLGRIPGVKMLFSSREETRADAETVVLITPHIVDDLAEDWNTEPVRRVSEVSEGLDVQAEALRRILNKESQRPRLGFPTHQYP